MYREKLMPDYLFEVSWEVCNKVGGIYTVLSTRAKVLTERFGDKLIFIGPDVWAEQECPYFSEDAQLLADWRMMERAMGLRCKVGRWNIPGKPIAVLVDFHPFFERKNEIYAALWEDWKVDSLHAYGDYDEASMFSYAAAKVAESFYRHYIRPDEKVVYHANEWMTGLGALYIKRYVPAVATLFTTHATSIGRSICGNQKPLYAYLEGYNGDQMACELNMQSKHSIEKQTAHNVDCFTTVSNITSKECEQLLEKKVDIVLPNGFEDDFVPRGRTYNALRKAARRELLHIANCLTGKEYNDETLIISTSGRYEFRNKGIDIFLSAMSRLRKKELKKNVVAFVLVPGWVKEPRNDLRSRLKSGSVYDSPLQYPQLTHWLYNQEEDSVMRMCGSLDMWNRKDEKVSVIFLPCYLNGNDGILDMEYYDVVLANDLCIFPSYYEPWGYTPLEAIAFKVPCITTDLAGFGLWVNSELGHSGEISDGVEVLHRTDFNYDAVVEGICSTVERYSEIDPSGIKAIRDKAYKLSQRALWKRFIKYYYAAYDIALRKKYPIK